MNEIIYHSLDIGTKNLKFLSISYDPEKRSSKIIHKNSYPSQGISYGYISNPDLFHQSLKSALAKYKKETKLPIEKISLSISSLGLKTKNIKKIQQTIDQVQITEEDLEEAKRKAYEYMQKQEDEIILDF